MPDFPVSPVLDVVSQVISSILPPRAYTYLFAFLPGLFFEISVLVANPELVCKVVARSREGFALGYYPMLGLALILAFVIGNAFILLVTLIQRVLGYLYTVRAFLWKQLCRWPLFPLLTWLLRKPSWQRRQWVAKFHGYVLERRLSLLPDDFEEGLRRCWALFARQLLKTRYGIEPEHLEQGQWNVLYSTLGRLTIEDLRGSLVMLATEATGWCGLAATRFAPTLKNRYYLAFCGLMIVGGLLHDFYVARNLNSPRGIGFMNFRAILRELRKSNAAVGLTRGADQR